MTALRPGFLVLLLAAVLSAGCARGVAIGTRERIQLEYDALGDAVARGDDAALAHEWLADPGDPGSPIAARARARDAGRALVSWNAHLHRFRMVGDTAVVDVSVRVVEQNAPADSTGRRVTNSVVRGFWVETPGSWRIVRTEALGPDQVAP
jgi:hypothetical protein